MSGTPYQLAALRGEPLLAAEGVEPVLLALSGHHSEADDGWAERALAAVQGSDIRGQDPLGLAEPIPHVPELLSGRL